jgi:hypothetical protein
VDFKGTDPHHKIFASHRIFDSFEKLPLNFMDDLIEKNYCQIKIFDKKSNIIFPLNAIQN